MNYRHGFHAGNFADVVKHAVMCRVLLHLRDKPAAFRVIDSHAGAGLYDLGGSEAGRTGEWRNGIERVWHADLDAPVRELLAPYLDAVEACNKAGQLAVYPGSPALVQALLRRRDRLIACELEPKAAAALQSNLRGDNRCKAIAIDGWTALSAYVPPKERRGLVLVDPPFEEDGEWARLVEGLQKAHRKWATGIYALWYPLKEPREVNAFVADLKATGITKMLRAELSIGPPVAGALYGSGMIVVNPPFVLEDELKAVLPALAKVLGEGRGGWKLEWIRGE
jgi:23S rRNA (adenine2030-N6)-methyltransferase